LSFELRFLVRCAICDDTGWKPIVLDGVARVVRCDCWRQQANERAIEAARIQKRYSHCELINFEQHYDSLRDAFRKAARFVEQFPIVEKGLLLHGSHGVGKTHLAVALTHALIARGPIDTTLGGTRPWVGLDGY